MSKEVRRGSQKFGNSQQLMTPRRNSISKATRSSLERKMQTTPVQFPRTDEEKRAVIRKLVEDNVPVHLPESVRVQVHQIHRSVCPPGLSKNKYVEHFQKAALFGLTDPTSPHQQMLVKALMSGIATELVGFLKAFAAQLMENDPYASEPSVVRWWDKVLETCLAVAENL